MSEHLSYVEIKFDRNVKLRKKLKIPNDSDIGYFVEVDLSYLDNIKVRTKNFIFAPENKFFIPDKFTTYMINNKSNTYTQTKKLVCD